MKINLILTGATGYVGEGVLLECLRNPDVARVLSVSRKPTGRKHPNLQELLVPDFFDLTQVEATLRGYDACLFCAGISAQGVSEAEYTRVTHDMTLHFARTLVANTPAMTFGYISGQLSDAQSGMMWARVKGQTESALFRLPFQQVYAFRPGLLKPTAGQQHAKLAIKVLGVFYTPLNCLLPKYLVTMRQVGQAMLASVATGYSKQILEVPDIKLLAARQ